MHIIVLVLACVNLARCGRGSRMISGKFERSSHGLHPIEGTDSLKAVAQLFLGFRGQATAFLATAPYHSQPALTASIHSALQSRRHAGASMLLGIENPAKRFDFRISRLWTRGSGGDGGNIERLRGGSDDEPMPLANVSESVETDEQMRRWRLETDEKMKSTAEEAEIVQNEVNGTKKILIILSDTGGGHKASARAIQYALEDLFPDKLDFEIIDIWTDYGVWPFNTLVESYAYLAKRKWMWRLMYQYAQFPPTRIFSERWAAMSCWGGIKECFEKESPDMIISVHPLCQRLPLRVANWMHGGEVQRREQLPFVTVVTDLGSSHPTWFHPRVDMTFVPSDVVEDIAKKSIPEERVHKVGLPIGPGFKARKSKEKHILQAELGLKKGVRTALIVGGGDGVGSLAAITEELADEMAAAGSDRQLVVVCGKNKALQAQLKAQEWPDNVHVSVLGFVRNMDEYMGAADAIITKAGPGTIAEACASGLPVMLSSFLPGQEAGNVPFVVDGGFGSYSEDPKVIAQTVTGWLNDPRLLADMSSKSRQFGRPQATKQIAQELGRHLFPES